MTTRETMSSLEPDHPKEVVFEPHHDCPLHARGPRYDPSNYRILRIFLHSVAFVAVLITILLPLFETKDTYTARCSDPTLGDFPCQVLLWPVGLVGNFCSFWNLNMLSATRLFTRKHPMRGYISLLSQTQIQTMVAVMGLHAILLATIGLGGLDVRPTSFGWWARFTMLALNSSANFLLATLYFVEWYTKSQQASFSFWKLSD